MQYEKPFLSFEEQASQLIERGMTGSITDIAIHLQDVGYYRLSGYWYIFKDADNSFKPGTSFSSVWNIYSFDRQLKLLTLDAIERVEVYFRSQLAHELSKATGPFGFMQQDSLPRLKADDYHRFLKKCRGKIKSSREPFILHFRKKYGDCHELPPYWMLVNTMDFGQMLTLYKGAPVEIRAMIAQPFGVSTRVLESWLVAINTVRNICAHHARLWNRVLGTQPMIPNEKKDIRWHEPVKIEATRLFSILTILSYLLKVIAPNTQWQKRLLQLLESNPEIDVRSMGFTPGWKECPFWNGIY